MSRALGVLLAACAAPAHPHAQSDVVYTFARAGDNVQIAIDVAGAPMGSTVFDLGEVWGGAEHPEAEVRNVRADALVVEHDAATWTVHHAPGAHLHLTYELASTHRDPAQAFHRPIVEPHLIQIIGNTGLLRPRYLANAPHAFTVRWAMPGWTAVSSYGDAPEVTTTATLDEFRDAVFLASDRLHLVKRSIDGTSLVVAIVNEFAFGDDAFADLATKIVTAQRAFFAERGPPFFLITAIPLGEGGAHQQHGGTGLVHSFAVFMSKQFSDTTAVAWLLGHELFHQWNGGAIQPDPPEELMYWFSEGFTNFYARRLLYRAGIADLDTTVKNLDDELSTYFLSEVRDESNDAIRKGFWKSHDIERLPYERGNLIALILDRALVAHGSSLDALMRTLVAEAHRGQGTTKTVSVDKLLARMPPATAAILKKTIVDGATLSVDPQLLAPCLAMTTRTVGRFELGFDFGATQASRKVSGVVPGSRAAAAGLRDGDPVTGWSITYGKPEIPVEVQLGGRTLTYLPQGAPVEVPVFSVADASACRSIL